MQRNPVPPYKPPPQLQEHLENNNNNNSGRRRQTAVLPKRSWIQRNPRIFQITFITTSLLILFSKPLYDAFIVPQVPRVPGSPIVPAHRR